MMVEREERKSEQSPEKSEVYEVLDDRQDLASDILLP
jgi:hypothetical protein